MRKFSSILLLLLLLSFAVTAISAQQHRQMNITGRTVGSGTHIETKMVFYGENYSIEGIQMKIERSPGMLMPYNFYLGEKFYSYQSGWVYPQPYYDGKTFSFGAVGDPTTLSLGDVVGKFSTHVDDSLSGEVFLSTNISFSDGTETNWAIGFSRFKIINLPFERYGNYNNDGMKNIKDGIELWKYVGMIPTNDTVLVAFDLDGTGEITDYDEYIFLDNIVNNRPFPIHMGNTPIIGGGGGAGNIVMTWEKIDSGKWGLFSKEYITNGNITVKEKDLTGVTLSPAASNFMSKKLNNKIYFAGVKGILSGNAILIADEPIEIFGTVNKNRPIRVETTITDAEDNKTIPDNFLLEQNYPNPFNPSTVISYQIPTDGAVMLKIYNVTGEEVRTLINENKPAGKHEVRFDASGLPSGVYMYKISSGNFVQVKKMLLMK